VVLLGQATGAEEVESTKSRMGNRLFQAISRDLFPLVVRRYDKAFWGTGGDATAAKILQAFEQLGYNITVDPLGPDSAMAKAGVKGDAIENQETLRFQSHFNKVSNGQGGDIGGLELDGQIGPCVITALKFLTEDRALNAQQWRMAVTAGTPI